MSNVVEKVPQNGAQLSTDAVRLAGRVTGGPALWFLWQAGSGQELLRLPPDLVPDRTPISVSSPGQSIEFDARLFDEASERWRGATPPSSEKLDWLLDRWMADESGYDEETWPELKRALDRNRGESGDRRRLFVD